MSYLRFVVAVLLILSLCAPLTAEEENAGESKLLPLTRFDGLHSEKVLKCALTDKKLVFDAEEDDTHFILDVSTGEEKEISHDVLGSTPIQVIDGRLIYFCWFTGNARDTDYRIRFKHYDLETKKWSDPASIPITENLCIHDHRMTTTVDCIGTEAFFSSTIHNAWKPEEFPGENAEKFRNEEARYLHVFIRADMETGNLIDKVSYCSGFRAAPHIQVLGYDPFRRNLVKYDSTCRKLFFESMEGDPKGELDASKYFPGDEKLRAKAYEKEILVFGDSNYLLLDAGYKIKGVIPNKCRITSVATKGEEKIDRFSDGCFYVNRRDSADVVLDFKEDKNPITVLGYVYRDVPIRDGVLYWSSRWGDLMKISKPDFKVEVVKERYIWEESREEYSFSGAFLFQPSCDGKKLIVRSVLTGKLEKVIDYCDNPIVEFATASDGADRVAVLLSDGKLQVINSISLAVEKEVLLKDCADGEFLECKMAFSKHQFIVLFWGSITSEGFRFDCDGQLIESFNQDDDVEWGLMGVNAFTSGERLIIPYGIEVDMTDRWDAIVGGGYLLDYTCEPGKEIDFAKISLDTGKETRRTVEWFENADKVFHELTQENGSCYSEPNLVVSYKGDDGLRIYCMNLDTGKVNCEKISDDAKCVTMYIAPLSKGRFMVVTFDRKGCFIYSPEK